MRECIFIFSEGDRLKFTFDEKNPIFKTKLRSMFPGPPIYFTGFIFGMVISYYHISMGI